MAAIRRGKFLLYHWRLCAFARACAIALHRLERCRAAADRRCSGSTNTRKRSTSRSTAVGDALREQLDRRAQRAARHLVRHEPDGAGRSRTRCARTSRRRSRTSRGCGRRAAAAGASCTCGSRSTTSGGWARRRRSRGRRTGSNGAATCSSTRRRSARAAGKATAFRRLDRQRDRRVPPASAEQDPRTQHRPDNHRRGNILVWEQSLSDRLRGVPLDARGAGWRRSRFSIGRSGCSRRRSWPWRWRSVS